MKRYLSIAFLCCLVTASAWADWGWGNKEKATEVYEETVALASGSDLSVETTNGSIEVSTWDRDEVEIVAKKKARASSEAEAQELLAATQIKVSQQANGLAIEVDRPSDWSRKGSNVSVSFELRVPRRLNLEARSTNGAVAVESLEGAVNARTTNGAIALDGISGAVEIRTTNGSIRAEGIGGRIDARTTNGSISAEMTQDASILEDMRLTTTNGAIELAMPATLGAEIDAKSQNGGISSEFPGEIEGKYGPKRLRTAINGGGPRIELETTNGRIRLNKV